MGIRADTETLYPYFIADGWSRAMPCHAIGCLVRTRLNSHPTTAEMVNETIKNSAFDVLMGFCAHQEDGRRWLRENVSYGGKSGVGETLQGRKTKGKGISHRKAEAAPEGSKIFRTESVPICLAVARYTDRYPASNVSSQMKLSMAMSMSRQR